MRINVCMHEDTEDIDLAIKTLKEKFGVDFTELYLLNSGEDYNSLVHKPSINSVTLQGALTAEDLGLGSVYYDTKVHWDLQPNLVTERSAIYIYSDYQRMVDRNGNVVEIAGIKIGDGASYLIDMPFVTEATSTAIINHIANSEVHVTSEEKTFWNNKVSSYLDSGDLENLVLSKTNYTTQGDIYNG